TSEQREANYNKTLAHQLPPDTPDGINTRRRLRLRELSGSRYALVDKGDTTREERAVADNSGGDLVAGATTSRPVISIRLCVLLSTNRGHCEVRNTRLS